MPTSSPSVSKTFASPLWLRATLAAAVAAFFLRFVLPSLSTGFAVDDPMNIHYYWQAGPSQLLRNLLLFATDFERPMGGVYYSLLYQFFGLNPLPYHAAAAALLLVNCLLAFRFARLISGCFLTAALAVMPLAFQPRMAQLTYLPSYIFDILCFTFFVAALAYYVSIRSAGLLLTWKQTAVFLMLYAAALESKEMAVTLPLLAFLYEAIYHSAAKDNLRRRLTPTLLSGLLTAVFLLGKALGQDSLLNNLAYQPVLTFQRYTESTARFLDILLIGAIPRSLLTPAVLFVPAVTLCLLFWRGCRRDVRWLLCFVCITPLPVAFIPGREGGCLYIPLFGWALLASTAILWLCARLQALSRFALPIVLALVVAGYWIRAERVSRRTVPAVLAAGRLTASVLSQIRSAQPAVPRGSRIYVVNDPFELWDAKFLFELQYKDPTVSVALGRLTPLPPNDIAAMDYVFTFDAGRLVRLKSP
ncbi:MAG: hypothetical protein HZB13_21755 [Acidobacteria bacterium]|nr:hypothetical protein [Acidobacteriota bacterium]